MGTTEDLTFAGAVSKGDSHACARFVDEYTDLVLSRVWKLSKTHCRHPARNLICSLIVLRKQREGPAHFPEDQCNECMDSYVWFFEYLKNRISAYRGDNNCSLSTFIFSVAESHSTYIDWLRWKYKRCDRPPKCIERLDEISQKVFQYLCERKNEDTISRLLNLDIEETREKIHIVKTELIRTGQIDLVREFLHVSIHTDDEDEYELPIRSDDPAPDETNINKQHKTMLYKAISELPGHRAMILKLHIREQLSARDILGFFRKMHFSPVPDKDVSRLSEQDIYYEINKGKKEIMEKLRG